MNRNHSKKEQFAKFKTLPPSVRDLLLSSVAADAFYNITKKSGIADEKIADVAYVVNVVQLGLEPRETLGKMLREDAGLEEKIASSLENGIRSDILILVDRVSSGEVVSLEKGEGVGLYSSKARSLAKGVISSPGTQLLDVVKSFEN